jgi:hypothetical protein
MLDKLPQIAISLVIFLVVGFIGLGIAQQAVTTIQFEENSTFYNTTQTLTETVDSAFGWFPMLILAIIGGVALSAVIAYGDFFGN